MNFKLNLNKRSRKMTTHEELKNEIDIYLKENEKFTEKCIKSSSTKARNALSNIMKLAKLRRSEILEEKEKLN